MIKNIFVLTLLMSGCSLGRTTSAQDTIPLIGTTWIVNSINGQPLNAQVFLKLDDEDRLTGFAGCNRFFANYILAEDRLEFGLVGSTKMMCPDMETENLMFATFDQTRYYLIEDDMLILLNEEHQPLATASLQIDD